MSDRQLSLEAQIYFKLQDTQDSINRLDQKFDRMNQDIHTLQSQVSKMQRELIPALAMLMNAVNEMKKP